MRLTTEIHRQASMIGYINAFYLLALTVAVAVPLVRLMRPTSRWNPPVAAGRKKDALAATRHR